MALDVKYLRGTKAQYAAYIEANKLVDTYYYLIYESEVGVGTPILYIGKVLLSEATEIAKVLAKVTALEEKIPTMESEISTLKETVANLKEGTSHNFYEATSLPEFVEGHPYKKDDVIIVTETKENIDFKTAYHCIVDAEGNFAWAAMAGNYNATNVYYDKDIQVTQSVGNITTSNNAPVNLKFKGKNMEQIWQYLYATEDLDLTIVQPNATMSVSSGVTKEVGNIFEDPTITINFFDGRYEYGSKDSEGTIYKANEGAGVLWNAAEIKVKDGESLKIKTESSNASLSTVYNVSDNIVHGDNDNPKNSKTTTYYFTGTASCPASNRKPVTNLNNFIDEDGKVTTVFEDGTKETLAINNKALSGSFSVTGFRGCFWGYKSSKTLDPMNLTSANIRALGNGPSNGLNTIIKSLDKMQQIFVAAPKGKYSTVTVTNTDLGAAQTVKKVTDVMVEGANGYSATAYDVFYVNNDNADSKAYNYKITIA